MPSSPVTIQGIPIPGAAISGPIPMVTPPQGAGILSNSLHSNSPRSSHYKLVDLAVILGGMDTDGEIFEDCLVYLLSETVEDGQREDLVCEQDSSGACANP